MAGAPVNVGDEVDVKIESVGAKGDGIARVEGYVVFVPGVRENDEVKIRITKTLEKVGFGEVVGNATVEVEEPREPIEDTEDFGES